MDVNTVISRGWEQTDFIRRETSVWRHCAYTCVTELDLKARKGFWNGFCAQPRPSHVSSLGSQLGAGLVGFSVDPVSAIKEWHPSSCHCTCQGRRSPMSGATLLGTHVPCAQGEGEGAHDPVCSLALWCANCHPPPVKKGREAWWRCNLGKAASGWCPSFSPWSQSLLMSFQTWSEPRVHGMRYQNIVSCYKTLASYSLFKLIKLKSCL